MSNPKTIQEFCGGDVYMWLEEETSIMLKALSKGDPVELTADEAREIANALLLLADKLD